MLLRVNLYFHSRDSEDPVERWLLSLPPYRRGALIKRHLYALAARGQLSNSPRTTPAPVQRRPEGTPAARAVLPRRGLAPAPPTVALDQINRVMSRLPRKP